MTIAYFILAAIFEIGGCFAVWMWAREGASSVWLAPGAACLAAFAWLLTLADSSYAGRAYAAYGGVYILASLLWMWAIEARAPDRWDMLGAAICLGGAGLILYGPRSI